MAIYPIVRGQQVNQKKAIAPRAEPSSAPAASVPEGDLIDFGQDDPPAAPARRAPLDQAHNSTAEIQGLLAATGVPAKEGALIDFHEDLKKELPRAAIKRSDTEESNDNFLDAHE